MWHSADTNDDAAQKTALSIRRIHIIHPIDERLLDVNLANPSSILIVECHISLNDSNTISVVVITE